MPRGNIDNLSIPRSSEEARERGRKGGIKSGEVRRAKKNARQMARILLESKVAEPRVKEVLKNMGFADEDVTNQTALLVQFFRNAMSKGDVSAARLVLETAGYSVTEMMRNEAENEEIEENVQIYIPDNHRNGEPLL